MTGWPIAEVDTVARMRALVAAIPYAAFEERVLDASFEEVWGIAGDLENGAPRFEGSVRSIRITHRAGERLSLVAVAALGARMRFEVVLRPGWCLMRSRLAHIGMAAVPEGEGRTRFAHFEASPILRGVARPFLRRGVHGDLDRLQALLQPGGE